MCAEEKESNTASPDFDNFVSLCRRFVELREEIGKTIRRLEKRCSCVEGISHDCDLAFLDFHAIVDMFGFSFIKRDDLHIVLDAFDSISDNYKNQAWWRKDWWEEDD